MRRHTSRVSQALAAATSLASLLRKSAPHQVAEAEELLRTSLDLLVQSQGALHPETLVAKNQLGQLLHETGRQDEALSLLQDTLTGRLEVLGNSHPQVFNARSALSRLYKDMGRHADAAMVLRPQDVVDVKKVVGSTHRVARQVSDTLDDISNAYEEIEKAMVAPWKGKALPELPPLPSFKPRSKQSSRKSAVAEQLDEVAEETSSHQGASSVKGRGERKDVLAQAARRMRDPAYTCREFYADMVYAFPELGLYLTEPLAWKTLMQLPELLLGGHMMEERRKSFSDVRKVSQQTTSGMTALEVR